MAPRDIKTTLNYCAPLDSNPLYKYVFEPPPGVPRTNFTMEAHPVIVRDVRGTSMEGDASLDVHGFQFIKHVAEEKEFLDEKDIQTAYYREVEELIKSHVPGARKVFIFDHTIRWVHVVTARISQLMPWYCKTSRG